MAAVLLLLLLGRELFSLKCALASRILVLPSPPMLVADGFLVLKVRPMSLSEFAGALRRRLPVPRARGHFTLGPLRLALATLFASALCFLASRSLSLSK